jgi:hypothetical protein
VPIEKYLTLLAGVGIVVLAAMGPALACTIPLPKMTREDVENASVAFVGTVKSIGERGVEILDHWPGMRACQRMFFDDKPMCPSDQPVTVAVFEVEEPIHGVETGQEFVVPQGYGADCATPYKVDRRYLFGSTGINFDEGRRYKPVEKPWMAFAEDPEASLADETYRGIDARVLAELIGVLRWEQEAPDGLKVSDLKLTWYDRPAREYVALTDTSSVDWGNLDAWPALTICGTFEVADEHGNGSGPRAFAYHQGNPLTFSQRLDSGGGDEAASDALPARVIDGLLETWGCLEEK